MTNNYFIFLYIVFWKQHILGLLYRTSCILRSKIWMEYRIAKRNIFDLKMNIQVFTTNTSSVKKMLVLLLVLRFFQNVLKMSYLFSQRHLNMMMHVSKGSWKNCVMLSVTVFCSSRKIMPGFPETILYFKHSVMVSNYFILFYTIGFPETKMRSAFSRVTPCILVTKFELHTKW